MGVRVTAANYRTPSRPADRVQWGEVKMQVLALWEAGYGSTDMAEILARPEAHANQHTAEGLRPGTVRGYYQRIYNEYRMEPGRRTPAAALAEAYRRGDLPCPHAHQLAAQPQPRAEESFLDRINRVREEGRRGVGVQSETYLDRINRVRPSP
jgi:hypothetical protein